jgi:tetratricopeptide (TPR) repeat protein
LTWLHVSDFHIKSGDTYDSDVVLRALVESVRRYAEQGRKPDLIFATGDIAHSGKAAEYEIAGRFFDELLSAAGLDKSRLFVIPGNHDVDRDLGEGLARTLESREQADKYFHPERPKPHLTLKLSAYLDWHNRYFDSIRVAPGNSTCGPVIPVDLNGDRLAILPINSALFCQDDHDHGNLCIGRRCLDAALADLGKHGDVLKIALVHHPLDWLNPIESTNIQAEIEASVQILLRGHLHETRIDEIASPEGRMLRFAAGAAYQTRKWPNRALYATWSDDHVTIFPIRYEDAPRPKWTTDPSVFPHDADHQRSFPIPGRTKPPIIRAASTAAAKSPAPPAQFRSNVQSRGNLPFVGRDQLIERMESILANPATEAVVVLHGAPGVGKSELAREFARRRREHYSGGTFWVDASTDAIAIHLANIAKTILGIEFPATLPLDDQGQMSFRSLGTTQALLIYDNVVSFDAIQPWLPLSGMPLHVLVTTLEDVATVAWPCLEVERLSHDESLELVEKLTDGAFAKHHGKRIAAHGDGLPVQIVPETMGLAYERRHGRTPSTPLGVMPAATQSFSNAYRQLETPAKLLLHTAAFLNSQQIPAEELERHLRNGVGWADTEIQRALDACLDLHLLQGTNELSMHRLFAAFLIQITLATEERTALTQIRSAQRESFVESAEAVEANPADTQAAARFISFPLIAEGWEGAGQTVSMKQGGTIGRALCGIGRFVEVQTWFKRAVAEAEKGYVHGRIDHASLGHSLHQIGYCLSSTGKYVEARLWFERAVAEAEKEDVHGRVDHASLGRSLHQLGYCLSSVGQYADAQPWFERAVGEGAKGDVQGRVDHDGLGNSLHEVGNCLLRIGQHEEARPWFQRAVAEAVKGDVRGRIDHASLGSSLHQVGYCFSSTRQYADAQPWFERAVAEGEKGDVHGRIDHSSLGVSLRQIGHCLTSVGQYADAQPWFERAVAEGEKGDVHGRIDHNSLGVSLHQVGVCLVSTGRYAEARPWFERAVAESQKGDVHGRVNHEHLGSSLDHVGYCLSRMGQYAEAQPWFQRAVAEKEKGDVHGRIDHESFGVSLHEVGYCLSSTGQYAGARPWFERAVAEKEKGDVHERINRKSLSISLLAGADCLRKLLQDDRARDWERRAAEVSPSSSQIPNL